MKSKKGIYESRETITCPECGREMSIMEYEISEAGNPICPECREKEKVEE